MKKKFFKLRLVLSCMMMGNLYAQVGMPTNNPNKDAVLDLNRTDGTSAKGLLLPNVALTSTDNSAPMTAHVAGMHVWNTASTTGTNAVTPGEYYNDGGKWIRVASNDNAWLQDGNTNGSIKAIGTNDNFDLPIETNGTEKMRVTSSGQVLVNTTTPLAGGANAKLQINNGTTVGAIQIKDGTEGEGKILTSDVNGVATWKTNSPIVYLGTVSSSNVVFTGASTFKYTQYYIDVPAGRSQVTVGFLIVQAGGTAGYVTSQLSTSSSSLSGFTAFTSIPEYAGFACNPGTSNVGQAMWYINNTTGGPLRLYVWMRGAGGTASATNLTLFGSASGAAEAFIIATY